MRQLNFAAIFGLVLLTVYFTLQNTTATTINLSPNFSTSLPLAVLLLLAAGVGALGAWLFAGWSGMLSNGVVKEIETSKKRIQELEMDLTMSSKKRNVLPFMNFSSSQKSEKDVA